MPEGMWITLAWLALLACTTGALLTLVALRYASWRRLLDQPGHRRMHLHATPRGGGIAMVAVVAIAALLWLPMPLGAAFVAGLLLVAGIGWIDDHRPLSARVRLLVHLIAATLFVATLWPPQAIASVGEGVLFFLAVLGLAGAVNLWNFMDGSNGLVASQSAWVAGGLGVAFVALGAWPWAFCAVALAGACIGFLPFNAPRARIFMGDVGSGGLGFACGAMWLVAWDLERGAFWWLVLLPAVLLTDAGLTLLHRIARGRRWYTAHREHLYQWWIRAGASHVRVALLYLAWNVVVLLPAMWFAARHPVPAPWIALATTALGAAVWWFGKRAALRRVRNSVSR